jgi:hypothetical protein
MLESNGGRAWLVSEPIPPPRSGRLYVSVRLRTADNKTQPRVHVGIEGELDGRPFNRADQLGTDPTKVLDAQWREFVFPVEDLPTKGLANLRVTFDLLGEGIVMVDDVRLYDLYLTKREQDFMTYRIVAVAVHFIREGKYDACARLLDGYWPRMLAEYVPSGKVLAGQADEKDRSAERTGSSLKEALRWARPGRKH